MAPIDSHTIRVAAFIEFEDTRDAEDAVRKLDGKSCALKATRVPMNIHLLSLITICRLPATCSGFSMACRVLKKR